jgi:uncharacterized protein
MSRTYRWLLKAARTAHLYATLFGLALILFFAVTGFMLNHLEWFLPDEPRTRIESRPLPLDKLPGSRLPEPGEATGEQKLGVVEGLRKEFGVSGELWSFDNADEERIVVAFRRAGAEVEARIRREDGMTEVEHKSQGWAIAMTDLHRGNRGNLSGEPKFTGRVWTWVIDATCVLMLVISTTGLVLWWSLKSRGKWGPLAMLMGAAAAFSVYYWFVP